MKSLSPRERFCAARQEECGACSSAGGIAAHREGLGRARCAQSGAAASALRKQVGPGELLGNSSHCIFTKKPPQTKKNDNNNKKTPTKPNPESLSPE